MVEQKGRGDTQMKPFRFGVSIWHVQSRADLVEKARKVEAMGYATLTLPDHLTDRIAPVPALAISPQKRQGRSAWGRTC
jgi:hypothetical protein